MGNNITFNPEKPNENIINMVVEDNFWWKYNWKKA